MVGLFVGLLQTVVCIITGLVISLASNIGFISIGNILLLIVSQLPMLIINIFFGILFGIVLNDKSAPGLSSVFITLAGMLGGCWMPIETMGGFLTICRLLPFYPSVYIGRGITGAINSVGQTYTFDKVAELGLIPILIFMIGSTVLACIAFKRNMVSDK